MSPTLAMTTGLSRIILLAPFIAACASVPASSTEPTGLPSPQPTLAFAIAPFPSPEPTEPFLVSPTDDPCDVSGATPFAVVDDTTYRSVGPTPREIDAALSAFAPQWLDFRQTVFEEPWSTGVVFDQAAYGGPDYALNPSLLVVTVGIDLDWLIPSDQDLYSRAKQTARALHSLFVSYRTEEQVRSAYPDVANAATYALYRHFADSPQALEAWCQTYYSLFP